MCLRKQFHMFDMRRIDRYLNTQYITSQKAKWWVVFENTSCNKMIWACTTIVCVTLTTVHISAS
uniref:Uncharacterized protein n=2 Tax=Arion vulgaris TaxID=1028688 RepID=A0A0B7B5E0_9EUPU